MSEVRKESAVKSICKIKTKKYRVVEEQNKTVHPDMEKIDGGRLEK